ncbi:helix-turn-helix domain-containing protein [Dubosiella newyorkensis]|jgi:hypothetical protein|uniref:helix-turn-helix domain-containing protein n=1 Tax=Dubosiella newyorkensis TaxID=1862672 RepID=UPI002356E5D2|nr:helix-turn-helix transcriptional regulator [Dubosiella newyorkensis]MCI9042045.1 helix-turn-helix transcriptional regulator [Dubosiella newyorkensis]
MKEFAEVYEEVSQGKSVRVYEMADFCQIAPQSLYQILNGKRKPTSRDLVLRIAEYLQLRPKEREKLVNSYFMTIIGKDVYIRRKSVTNFFDSYKEGIGDLRFFRTSTIEELPNLMTISNTLDLAQLVYNMFFETKKEVLCMYLPSTFPILANLVRSYEKEGGQLHIEHIFGINRQKQDTELENSTLRTLQNLIPIYMGTTDFKSYYFYEDMDSFMYPFPYYILSHAGLIQIASDFKNAILIKDEKIQSLYYAHFNAQRKYSTPFNVELTKSNQIMKNSLYYWQNNQESVVSYRYYPFLYPLLDEELLKETTMGMDPDFLAESIEYMDCVRAKLEAYPSKLLFTFEGIQKFMKFGYLGDIDSMTENTFNLRDRKEIIGRLIDKYDEYGYVMLKGMFGGIDPLIQLMVTPSRGYVQIFNEHKQSVFLGIRNEKVLFLFKDYLENIPENLVYTPQEAKQLLKRLLE